MNAHFHEAGKKPHKIKTLRTSVEFLLIKILSFDQCLHYTGDGSGNLKIRYERNSNETGKKSQTVDPSSKPFFFFSPVHPWHPIKPKNEGLTLCSQTFWVTVTELNFQLFI